MEHLGIVSWIAFLPTPALVLGVGGFLPGASVSGGAGHVLLGSSLDEKSPGGVGGGSRVFLQWLRTELPDVAQLCRLAWLVALGDPGGGTRLVRGWTLFDRSERLRRFANARRDTRVDSLHMVPGGNLLGLQRCSR